MNRPWPDIQINVATMEPIGIRAGYAPHEDRIVIQMLLPNGRFMTFAIDPDAAYTLCRQIAEIGEEIAEIVAPEATDEATPRPN